VTLSLASLSLSLLALEKSSLAAVALGRRVRSQLKKVLQDIKALVSLLVAFQNIFELELSSSLHLHAFRFNNCWTFSYYSSPARKFSSLDKEIHSGIGNLIIEEDINVTVVSNVF
jgi:hypothetical protein